MRNLTIFASLTLLAGCSTGMVVKEPIMHEGKPVITWWGGSVKRVEKYSRTAVIERSRAEAIVALANMDKASSAHCEKMLTAETSSAAGEAEKFRSYASCKQSESTAQLVATALGRPTTDVQAVAAESTLAVKHVQDGLTRRTVGLVTQGKEGLLAGALLYGLRGISKDRRDENIAAVRNSGDTNIDNFSISADQTASAAGGANSSNDVGASVPNEELASLGDLTILNPALVEPLLT